MKRSLLLFLLTFSFSAVVSAEAIALFSFSTSPQTILSNTLSKEITIQSQNRAFKAEAVTETFDLEFNSSSPTGLFLGSTGKPVSKTMARGTANRTFYYKDQSLGDFVLTVKAMGRDSKKSFSTMQHIVVADKIKTTKPSILPISKKIEPAFLDPKIISKSIDVKNSSSTITLSTSTVEVFKAPTHSGFISTLFVWPIKIFNFLKHLFVEN